MGEPSFELLVGDARAVLRSLPADSAHACVTSPPYWGLRSYGTEPQRWDDGWRGELGQEPTPYLFVEHLVSVFEEVKRVLRPDGVLFVNIDDSYNNRSVSRRSSHQGGLGFESDDLSKSWADLTVEGRTRLSIEDGVLKEKDLALVPQRLVIALQEAGWYVRCDILWTPPNVMPESVQDRPTRAAEYVWMLTREQRYFWDQQAVKEALADGEWTLPGGWRMARNMRSVWQIPTENFYGEHYAVMPIALAERAILASTSATGCCPECGAPVVRQVETRSVDRHELPRDHPEWRPRRYDNGKSTSASGQGAGDGQRYNFSRTLGWAPSCQHTFEPVPCTVLDPFGGACTTAVAARRLGRSSVSVELSPDAAEIGRRRMASWWRDLPRQPQRDTTQLTLEAV